MANTYVITNLYHLGDNATVTGTVDGTPVVVTCWWSAITQLPNVAAVQAFLGPLMLQAAQPNQPVTVGTYNGTWVA